MSAIITFAACASIQLLVIAYMLYKIDDRLKNLSRLPEGHGRLSGSSGDSNPPTSSDLFQEKK